MVLGGEEYETVLTVDDDEVDAVEFSSSSCCTCRMSTYSSSWFCDDVEISVDEFGLLAPLRVAKIFLRNFKLA